MKKYTDAILSLH